MIESTNNENNMNRLELFHNTQQIGLGVLIKRLNDEKYSFFCRLRVGNQIDENEMDELSLPLPSLSLFFFFLCLSLSFSLSPFSLTLSLSSLPPSLPPSLPLSLFISPSLSLSHTLFLSLSVTLFLSISHTHTLWKADHET